MFLLNNNMPTHTFGMSPESDIYHSDPYYSTNTTYYTQLYPADSQNLVNGKTFANVYWISLKMSSNDDSKDSI